MVRGGECEAYLPQSNLGRAISQTSPGSQVGNGQDASTSVEAHDLREGYIELLVVHSFEEAKGPDGPGHGPAKSRPWGSRILELVEEEITEN